MRILIAHFVGRVGFEPTVSSQRQRRQLSRNEKGTESEERRLFYVAVTRARADLRLSMAKKNPMSRFVLEAGLKA